MGRISARDLRAGSEDPLLCQRNQVSWHSASKSNKLYAVYSLSHCWTALSRGCSPPLQNKCENSTAQRGNDSRLVTAQFELSVSALFLQVLASSFGNAWRSHLPTLPCRSWLCAETPLRALGCCRTVKIGITLSHRLLEGKLCSVRFGVKNK